MDIIESALNKGQKALSEYESKLLLANYGIPVSREKLVRDRGEALSAAQEIGYPVVLKGCAPDITHKTEENLIAVDLRNETEVEKAFESMWVSIKETDGGILVQEMVKGIRELVIGLIRDPQFGPCVMFGLGGIFTEILRDVSFRVAPIEKRDALEMMKEIKAHKILDAIRGLEPVDLDVLSNALISLGQIGMENERVKEIDVNPMIVRKGQPVAVDALVVLD
jgi:acetyl-CoA synthetase (ADP-forming)